MTAKANVTFKDLIETIEKAHEDIGFPTEAANLLVEALEIAEELQEEYAPTVEMTQQEFEVFSKAKVDEDSAEWLDDVEWGRVDYKYPDFFMAWLHPETVKIIDDDQS